MPLVLDAFPRLACGVMPSMFWLGRGHPAHYSSRRTATDWGWSAEQGLGRHILMGAFTLMIRPLVHLHFTSSRPSQDVVSGKTCPPWYWGYVNANRWPNPPPQRAWLVEITLNQRWYVDISLGYTVNIASSLIQCWHINGWLTTLFHRWFNIDTSTVGWQHYFNNESTVKNK